VIGALLPAERIVSRASELAGALSSENHQAFAEAICTTDRWPKIAHALVGSKGAALLAIAKGAGMIHPDLAPLEKQATLLVFLFTDAIVEREVLESSLIEAVDTTFNACSVDGDTSTNDSIIALASGASGERVEPSELTSAFRTVCDRLARSVVADGEGSTQVVEIRVRGLGTREQARTVARTIATSLLSKTALFGRDPNWGRLLGAAGRAGVGFDPSLARIAIAGIPIVERGVTLGTEAEKRARAGMQGESYLIELELGNGPGEFSYLGCDLGHGYVDVNAGYRS
jgi:glutamate N-acetyltransferase/amino-acid N-acetyltransferase